MRPNHPMSLPTLVLATLLLGPTALGGWESGGGSQLTSYGQNPFFGRSRTRDLLRGSFARLFSARERGPV